MIDLVDRLGFPSYVSFDHDLGAFENGDGYKIAKYLVDLDLYTDIRMPDNFDYYVHSQNPIGKANIEGYLNGYLRARDRAREVPVGEKRMDEIWEVAMNDDDDGDITVGKLYDYGICLWFAFGIWTNFLIGDPIGIILNYIFYLFYEHIRKEQVHGTHGQ